MPNERNYDLVIIGGGPAGLCAAINAASEGLKTAIIDSKNGLGGQAKESTLIENYPGFPDGISGADLAAKFIEQAVRFETDILCPLKVVGLQQDKETRIVTTDDGEVVTAKAVILASGLSYRRLDARNIPQYLGRGIFYGPPTADVSRSKQNLFVVGGANSAGQAVCHLAKNETCRVVMLVRGKNITGSMSQYLVERIKQAGNVEVWYESEVIGALGHSRLESLVVRVKEETSTVPADALHIFIGAAPKTYWLNGVIEKDDRGFILSGSRIRPNWKLPRDPFAFETSMPGVFVAGDVRLASTKRMVAAAGEGSVAVQMVHNYLQSLVTIHAVSS